MPKACSWRRILGVRHRVLHFFQLWPKMLKPWTYALSRRFYALSLLLEAHPGGAALECGTFFNMYMSLCSGLAGKCPCVRPSSLFLIRAHGPKLLKPWAYA